MKRIKIMAVVITVLSFNSVRSELPSSIQNTLMDLSGVISITNIPKLETTVQRNQFFDNYSVLSMPDIEVNDQIQLQNIQTFSPSHRKVGLEALNQIKDITSGLVLQDVTVTPEDFKDIGMQDGKIVVPNIADKSQQVKDILEATNTVLQEVKSLNKKELNSLKLTISDMRDIQKITPIIQQQLSGAIVKDGKVNGVSIDIDAMGADLKDILKGTPDLFVNMTFADFDQMRDMRSNPDGSLIMPNYNRETASDNLNKFVDQSERISTYVGTGVLVLPAIEPQALPEFPMKGFDTITGKQNGFLNIVPELGSVASSFQVSDFTQNNPATFSWNNQSAGQLLNTENGFSGANISGFNANLIGSSSASAFEYMDNTSFKTFSDFPTISSNPLYFNNFNTNLLDNNLTGLCVGACQQKLSYGDLAGAMDEMIKNLPEGVVLK